MDHPIKNPFFFYRIKDCNWKKWKAVSTLVNRKEIKEGEKNSLKSYKKEVKSLSKF